MVVLVAAVEVAVVVAVVAELEVVVVAAPGAVGAVVAPGMVVAPGTVGVPGRLVRTMFGEVAQSGLTKPFMMMKSQAIVPSADELTAAGMTQEQFEKLRDEYDTSINTVLESAQPGYQFSLKDSAHNTYTTDYLSIVKSYPKEVTPDDVGTVDPDRAYKLISTYVVAFFDQEVKDKPSNLLANSSKDAEVALEIFNAK